ncbi:MAG: serine peptidase [endosymbiont of Galathealinum brachiosum]|uniref:Probable periplasmic serine endoprotease DegP-like n=1 Tax=endosymbiont of Galathealinum brachiosum TaxID=2200906 RepID=A0A370DII0_9GAMM|nr:MAG: serine peptidase [endosymbiont of Galathealinum brachiosum]
MLVRTPLLFLLVLLLSSLQLQASSLPEFADLVEENGKAVVNISTRQKSSSSNSWNKLKEELGGELQIPDDSPFNELFKHFLGEGMPRQKQESTSLGSGFILSEDGFIITNHHVVEGADEILVRLSDKRELSAKVIGSDEFSDIALLKVEANDLPVVAIGNSDKLRVGDWVLAIGSPFGFDHSATAGIVSAKGRSLPRANYVSFIQTDVAINPGNSGGPLFNLDGEVIGINSQIYSRTGGFMGLSFSIPVEVAMDVVKQLKKSGTVSRGWLGVYIQEITHEIAQSFNLDKPVGALVSQVIENSPAEKAGFKAGDVILSFNRKPILDSSDLPPLVGRVPVGSKANVNILRNDRKMILVVKIEELPSESQPIAAAETKPSSSNKMGVEVIDLDEDSMQALGRGVLVRNVVPGSVADQSGLVAGDVLLQLDRKNVKNVADFRKKVAKLPTGRMIPVLVHRQGSDQFIVMKITGNE